MAVRAVLLDLDETLIPDEAAVTVALAATVRAAAPALADATVERATAALRVEARARWHALPSHGFAAAIGISSWEALAATFDAPDSPAREEFAALASAAPQYRRGAWAAALAAVGIDDASVVDTCVTTFRHHREQTFRLFPEARRALPRLAENHRLAVVTNGPPDLQHAKVDVAGVRTWAEAVVVSGDVGIGKPDPAPLRTALERLGVDAGEAVMVGDSLRNDVGGAAAVGCRSVWLDRHGRGPAALAGVDVRPDAVLHDVGALPELLARW